MSRSLQDIFQEVINHCKIAGPVCTTFFLRKSTDLTSIIFVGQLGSHYLSAAGLASVTANVTGNSMIYGLAGALSTICSQAFGMKDFDTLTIALQRSIIILMTFICVPMTLLWWYSASLMVNLGQSPEIAHDTCLYLRALIPGLWALSTSACIQNWLHSQSKTKAIAIMTLITAILHPLWCYLYIYYFNFGYLGAAFSVSTTKSLELILLLVYINFFSNILNETNFKLQIYKSFQNWKPFLRLGLPNLLMMSEWWASEAVIFMSGSLPNPELQLSAMAIYQNTISICFMIPQGFHVSGSTRVGNFIGSNQASNAKLASRVSPSLAIGVITLAAITLNMIQYPWCYLFTSDKRVQVILHHIFPILCIYIVADGTQTALTGVIKGLGKQYIGGPIVIFSYYVIGLPISMILAFEYGFNLGIIGLCIGTLVGTWVHLFLYIIVIYRTDFNLETDLILSKQNQSSKNTIKVINEDDQEEDWLEEIDFLSIDSNINSTNKIRSFSDMKLLIYNKFANYFGWEKKLTDYEMVKTCVNPITEIEDDIIIL